MKLLMPLADGFEEIEGLGVISVLRGAKIDVDMVGVVGNVITGGRGVRVIMDKSLKDVKVGDYDGIVVPGGTRGCINLGKSEKVKKMLLEFYEQGKLVAGICAAPKVLAEAGVLKTKKATIYPGMEREIPYPRGDKIVIDGNVITSQGPGTVIDFALAIIEYLLGKPAADMNRKNLVA